MVVDNKTGFRSLESFAATEFNIMFLGR